MDKNRLRQVLLGEDVPKIIDVLNTLGKTGNLGDIKLVLAMTKHKDKFVVASAIEASGVLIKKCLLQDWSAIETKVRESLMLILRKLNPAVLNFIAKDLFSPNDEVKHSALQVLGLMGHSEKTKQVVSKMLTDNSEKVRATAISLLKKMVSSKDLSLVMRVLQDPDTRVRANGVEVLEELKNANSVSTLIKMRNDVNNRVRGNVIKALYNLGYKQVRDDLKNMLMEEDYLMRATAGWVLGMIGAGNEELFSLCGEYAIDRHPLVRSNMIKAMIKMKHIYSNDIINLLFKTDEIGKAIKDLEYQKKFR